MPRAYKHSLFQSGANLLGKGAVRQDPELLGAFGRSPSLSHFDWKNNSRNRGHQAWRRRRH